MTVAGEIESLAREVLGGPLPVRLRAWDGSEAGPESATVLVINTPQALRRLVWSPNELGMAQAYVTGEIDVEGDLEAGLSQVWAAIRARGLTRPKISPGVLVRGVRTARRLGALGPRPSAPRVQAQLSGEVNSRERDRAAITYHYNLSNDFYELILDESMAYSCAYYASPEMTLAEAQRAKLDLICRKLELRPGMRLLDVGCGWGSLTLHAAEHFRVSVTAVTLSSEQRAFVAERVAKRDLGHLVDVRLQDYRDIADGGFDAAATIEMGEHVGKANYPAFAAQLRSLLRPGGRLLVQQMSHGHNAPGGGAFIESYVAPDMHMRPLGETITLLENAGLEILGVQALREHYARTARDWLSTLESRWDEAVALIGEPMARVWRLYMVGGALTFAENRMGVDQILAVRNAD